MAPVRTALSIVVLTAATLSHSAYAAPGDRQVTHHPMQTAGAQVAQATPGGPGMGMGMSAGAPGPRFGEQMIAMQEMHEKMLAAKTPEERNALMAAQMTLMQKGMNMMGGMGGMGGRGPMGRGAATGQPEQTDDMAARQGMMEQRMEMMQSMMQMMMDRIPPSPAAK